MGLILGTPSDNVVSVTFRTTEEQNEKGQVYNIYVDDVAKLSGVSAGTYMIDGIEAGNRKVTVKAVLNGYESQGISDTIKVLGEVITDEPGTTKDSHDDTTSGDDITTKDSQNDTTPVVTTTNDSQKVTTSVKTTSNS